MTTFEQNVIDRRLSDKKRRALYENELQRLYDKYIRLDETGPIYIREACKHLCTVCQHTFSMKPKTLMAGGSRGCPNCRTSSNSVHQLLSHQGDLRNSTWRLSYTPIAFERSRRKRLIYTCTKCYAQIFETPSSILNTPCKMCTRRTIKESPERIFYEARLQQMYQRSIHIIGPYFKRGSVLHHCIKCNKDFRASVADMLGGRGCVRDTCRSNVPVKKRIGSFSINRSVFNLNSNLQARALNYLSLNRSQAYFRPKDLESRLDYPIPPLSSKHVPSFISIRFRIMVDVIKQEQMTDSRQRLALKFFKAAAELGYGYYILVEEPGRKYFGLFDPLAALQRAQLLKM